MHNWNEHLKKMDQNIGILIDKNKELFDKIESFKDDIITKVSSSNQRKGTSGKNYSSTEGFPLGGVKPFSRQEDEHQVSRRKTNSCADYDNTISTVFPPREDGDRNRDIRSKIDILSEKINKQTNILLEENRSLKKSVKGNKKNPCKVVSINFFDYFLLLEPNSNICTEDFEVKRYLNSEEDQHPMSAYRNGLQMEQV
jgi:hypothetical protein